MVQLPAGSWQVGLPRWQRGLCMRCVVIPQGISMRKLISTLKKKRKEKKAQAGNELSNNSPKILAHEEKAATTTTVSKS